MTKHPNFARAQIQPVAKIAPASAPRIIAYVSVGTLAELLDISESTIWDWVRHGHLPRPIKIGGSVRWLWADVEKHLTRSTQTSDDATDDPILRASRG